MSANTSDVNPFGEWNFVWLAYCDGTSQTSDRDQAVDAGGGKKLYFRGRALLDAHLHQLEQKYKFLSTATEVILSGTSAGGMSTFVQSSFVKSQLQAPNAKLVAVPDAGWWWDHTQYGDASKRVWLDSMTGAIGPSVWNATLRGSMAACLKDAEEEEEEEEEEGTVLASASSSAAAVGAPASKAKCFTQPYAYSYMTDVPTFIVQSFADPANIGICYKGPCSNFDKCTPSQLEDVQKYGQELKQSILTAQTQYASRDSHFMTSCNQHEETCRVNDWFGITIKGQTMNSTFYNWYTKGTSAAGSSALDDAWPSDHTCFRGLHGDC